MDCVRNASGFVRRVAVFAAAAAVVGVAAVGAVAFGPGTAGALPAPAATTNRAAVVVFVNGEVHTGKVTFSSDSISGLDALRDAGFTPTVRVFGGNGGAVCALDVGGTTIGCPADNSCLKCDKDSNYWAYFRALAGATRYTYSSLGAGNTQVHDGDVEAWTWSKGAAPTPFVSFDQVWAPPPTTTTRPVTTTPPTTFAAAPRSSTTVGALGAVTTLPTSTVPASAHGATTTTKPSTATTGRSGTSTTTPGASDRGRKIATGVLRKLATAPVVARGGGGSPYGLVGFGAIILALVAAIVVARRRRATTGPGRDLYRHP